MLTLRHIETRPSEYVDTEKYELLTEAQKVWKDPATPDVLFATEPDDNVLQFGTGTVYVMNSDGKTVAKYELDPVMESTGS